MSLSEISDPRAVEQAIAKFDRLGRDEFLREYKFGRAIKYFLVDRGRRYDSKAILGAAYGFQFPEKGALGPKDFHGGEAATVPRLRSLGFTIKSRAELDGEGPDTPPPTEPKIRHYWTLVAKPGIYDIDAALAAGAVESWSTRGRALRPGDGVIMWRTRGRDGRRGIVAIGDVAGEPFTSSDEHDPFWDDREAAAKEEPRIPIRLHDAPGLPLWADGEHRELLESLNVARAQGGTVFHVSAEQFAAIASLAAVVGDEPGELIEQFVNPLRRRGGQGRGLSAAERRAVERCAMDLAIAHYEQRWESVRDVGSTECFDLECRSGERVLRVEVKGTTGGGASVLLTANEVAHARAQAPHVALFVVSEIRLQREPEPVASGGTVRILEPWDIGACELRPVAYECVLPVD
jgi:hypothetical protein